MAAGLCFSAVVDEGKILSREMMKIVFILIRNISTSTQQMRGLNLLSGIEHSSGMTDMSRSSGLQLLGDPISFIWMRFARKDRAAMLFRFQPSCLDYSSQRCCLGRGGDWHLDTTLSCICSAYLEVPIFLATSI